MRKHQVFDKKRNVSGDFYRYVNFMQYSVYMEYQRQRFSIYVGFSGAGVRGQFDTGGLTTQNGSGPCPQHFVIAPRKAIFRLTIASFLSCITQVLETGI